MDSGVAAKRPGDSSANAGQPAPSATPVVSGAGAIPVGAIPAAAPSGAPGVVASSPGAKPVVPEAPYLGQHDLAGEDKIRFFDHIAELVSSYCSLVQFFFLHLGARQCSRWE